MPWNLSLETKGRYVFAIGILLLIVRVFIALFLGHDFSAKEANFAACCLRAGILLAVLGLAWDSVMKIPVWILLITPIVCVLLIIRPRIALFVAPILIALVGIKRWLDYRLSKSKTVNSKGGISRWLGSQLSGKKKTKKSKKKQDSPPEQH